MSLAIQPSPSWVRHFLPWKRELSLCLKNTESLIENFVFFLVQMWRFRYWMFKKISKTYIRFQHRILVASKSSLQLDNRLCFFIHVPVRHLWFFHLSDPCLIDFKQEYPAGKTSSGCSGRGGWIAAADAAYCIFHACVSNTQAFLIWEDADGWVGHGCNMEECDPGAVINQKSVLFLTLWQYVMESMLPLSFGHELTYSCFFEACLIHGTFK